ncbi:MAG TPA: J domain-containing protein [Myxococcota bacterium]|nr:J domain-containing protein [Myxococcota bacterium]HOA12560.1 J domain-containing protein [Myxococcota bacterium]HOC98975.1 J domain-containing protein [Myxococcota bacterium]HOH76473.1 J domain-containing protein [Myxococcota bacterium]HPV03546.1 J domain-containing protein [Myxococcota bacterium]
MGDIDNSSANASDLRALIEEKANCLAENDLYKLLGVPQQTPPNGIRDAYFALAKQLHPDSIAKAGIDDVRPQAVEVFKGIANAYRTLTDPRKKAEYDAVWARAAGVSLTPTQAKTKKDLEAEARMFFHKGNLMVKRMQWEEAIAAFRKAVELDERNSEYLVSLGWSVMQNEKLPKTRRLEEARGWFERAISSENPTASSHYYMSLYYKAVGDVPKQRLELQDALTIDPGHIGAQRERRLLNMRQQNENKADLFAAVKRWWQAQTGPSKPKK